MIRSGIWTDRNKSSAVLWPLTQSRDPQLLARPPPFFFFFFNSWAFATRIVLGRIAGIRGNGSFHWPRDLWTRSSRQSAWRRLLSLPGQRLIGTPAGRASKSVPMSRDAAGTSARATGDSLLPRNVAGVQTPECRPIAHRPDGRSPGSGSAAIYRDRPSARRFATCHL